MMSDVPYFDDLSAAGSDIGNGTGVRESLTDRGYRQLEEDIVWLRLAPGTAVTERKLSEMTGIGRTPARSVDLRYQCGREIAAAGGSPRGGEGGCPRRH
jgi:hypothetical protein